MSCYRTIDMEDLNAHLDACMARTWDVPTAEDIEKLRPVVKALVEERALSLHALKKKYGCFVKNSFLYQVFQELRSAEGWGDEEMERVRERLKICRGKSHSGILSVTVFMSGDPEYVDEATGERRVSRFSCAWDCAYCPHEPGQPRSYLRGEPGVMRANRCGFDCVRQMHDRMQQLLATGHLVDKLEVNVLGGTLCSYPEGYVREFVRDIYYAANVFWERGLAGGMRERRSLAEEKRLNAGGVGARVIGLTLETRPDTIDVATLRRFREYGCTRVQLGLQHVDDGVLARIQRRCTRADGERAIRMLKDAGYKIDGHWMPNLPGSCVELDTWMLCDVLLGVRGRRDAGGGGEGVREVWDLRCPGLQVDQWKLYPCTVTPYTKIEEWYKDGTYVPYGQEELKDLLLRTKSMVFPWIRLNRVVRDIPNSYSVNPEYCSSLRDELHKDLAKDGWFCACIRCREVREEVVDLERAVLRVREYEGSGGRELFISLESPEAREWKLYGFVRLRLTKTPLVEAFPELEGCAMVRELHVYGVLKVVGEAGKEGGGQHQGIGRRLMAVAEAEAVRAGFGKVSVIAGEGTRGYYAKLGYVEDAGVGEFMIKMLATPSL